MPHFATENYFREAKHQRPNKVQNRLGMGSLADNVTKPEKETVEQAKNMFQARDRGTFQISLRTPNQKYLFVGPWSRAQARARTQGPWTPGINPIGPRARTHEPRPCNTVSSHATL